MPESGLPPAVPESIRELLEERAAFYNRPAFLENDPVSVPHLFGEKADREIAGFFAAVLAWGNRKSILASARNLMERMDMAPHAFVIGHEPSDLKSLDGFVHRTFNATDARCFVRALRSMYRYRGGMESVFADAFGPAGDAGGAINRFRSVFFEKPHPARSEKHLGDPLRGSTAKRMCMFLRWMVRRDRAGVDLGLWDAVRPAQLFLPLDVHSARVARKLGLLRRPSNDWRAVSELTACLRQLDPIDPVRFDFALFGMGVDGTI